MGTTEGQRDGEARSLPDNTLDGDLAAMQPDQFLNQREADAAAFEAAALRALHAVEALEEPRQFLFGNADAGVAHLDDGGPAVGRDADRDRDLAGKGELEGVREQVQQNLLPHLAIDIDRLRQRRAIEHQPEIGLLDGRPEARGDARAELGKIGRPVGGLHAARLDAREIEQAVDQAQQPVAVAVRQHRMLPRLLERDVAVQHFLERAQHEGERRAEFVADVGEEGGLGAVEFGQRLDPAALLLIGIGAGDRRRDLAGRQLQELPVRIVEQPVGAEAHDQEARPPGLARRRHGDHRRRRGRPVPDATRHRRAEHLGQVDEPWRLVRRQIVDRPAMIPVEPLPNLSVSTMAG